jgi:phosphoglycolate phosphatase-like HAD superfamily hydrolase
MRTYRIALVAVVLALSLRPVAAAADPLPSWREGPVKTAVLDWLAAVTLENGPDYIPPAERIAVFDNDGTSLCERPHGGSSTFQKDLVRSLVREGRIDPERMPFSAWLADDRDALRAYGWSRAYADMNAGFAGMTLEAYRDSARAWIDRNPHPRYGVLLPDLYYRPMRELMELLESRGFMVWIVTASTQDFARSFAPDALDIPPGQVIGTWTEPEYREVDGRPLLLRSAVQHDNGHENKPGAIATRIGRRPVFAAGNSNNDHAMLNWTLAGPRRALALWIHHDDDAREYAYDRGTDRIAALMGSHANGHVVSMRRDWARIFAFE